MHVSMNDLALRNAPTAIPDIEALAVPTADERHRQGFCSALRRHAIQTMATDLEADFAKRVAPMQEAKGDRFDDARAIAASMKGEASFRFYSSVRYNAQEMCFQSVQPQVERGLPAMIEVARAAREHAPSGGTLRLDPTLEVPRYVNALDVHLMPGCFHSEWTDDDVAQGAVASLGSRVFTADQAHRTKGGVAKAIAQWVSSERPGWTPKRVLDLGTTSGKNLMPYRNVWPEAEIHGVDVSAPLLRYGHALAEHEGVPVHFSQQNAEALDYESGSFDLIVSSFFFHEIPVKAARRVLRECRRLLAPSGMTVHQELPSSRLVSAYEDYFWNWDTLNNNEPSYSAWRAEDHSAMCVEAGFDDATAFAAIIPDPGTFPDQARAFDWNDSERPMHGRGGWYVFGATA